MPDCFGPTWQAFAKRWAVAAAADALRRCWNVDRRGPSRPGMHTARQSQTATIQAQPTVADMAGTRVWCTASWFWRVRRRLFGR